MGFFSRESWGIVGDTGYIGFVIRFGGVDLGVRLEV